MIKTQIQVPEKLYAEIRAFAKEREWSLAETFRRSAELLLQTYPDTHGKSRTDWVPPTSRRVGWKGLTDDALRDAVFTDGDPDLHG